MDPHHLLDLTEELLQLYGYSIRRHVGIVGEEAMTVELTKEGIPGSPPPEVEKHGLVLRADLLAEKTDIERPFGRIVANYRREPGPAGVTDVLDVAEVRAAADAYLGLLLAPDGFEKEAADVALENQIEIITPHKIENMIGKMTAEKPWWQHYPAFALMENYEDSIARLKFFMTSFMHYNWSVGWIKRHELAYMPYWKFTYYIAKTKERKLEEFTTTCTKNMGFLALNAHTGEIDFLGDCMPDEMNTINGPEAVLKSEPINWYFRDFRAKLTKISKPPNLPKHVVFQVLKPALEKHEAKIAAQNYISQAFNVEPEQVIIAGRELVFAPMWRFLYINQPPIKNIHMDSEWQSITITGVDGHALNIYKWYNQMKRQWYHPYLERIFMYFMGGPQPYITFFRKFTYTLVRFYQDFNLRIPRKVFHPISTGIVLLLTTYLSYVFAEGSLLDGIAGFLVLNIIFLPLYIFLYLLWDWVKFWPYKYPHPKITPKDWDKFMKEPNEQKASRQAYEKLLKLQKEGKLTKEDEEKLKLLRERYADVMLKKIGA